jgi:hypothetical protein
MNDIAFTPWPKTARLFRDVVITEKIDGTNAAVHITADGRVVAQSRKRLITPEQDNHGFAAWAAENAEGLVAALGTGTHFGEWWGSGINRGYGFTKGMSERFFSLFNTGKWAKGYPLPLSDEDRKAIETFRAVPNLSVVPVLYNGAFSEWQVDNELLALQRKGSAAAPGFMNPEGICIFHTQSRNVYKVTLDGDGHKGEAA